MAEKVVSVRLQARVEGFTAGMRKAKASVDDLTRADVPKAAKGYADLANKAALAGAAISVGLGVAVKRFADFDKAMSAVAANTGAAGEELEALRQSALKLGADSQFSATEAAQGVNELAKAGVAAGDILGGGLKGSLDLAAAGQISVADAAETAATAMTQFKLEGSQVPHIADLLANSANKAQGGVSDMAQALKQSGLVAAATGLTIEETTAGLTAFASAGLIGSDAGTSFKTMLQRLSAPTKEAKAAMDELGISAYDGQGNFVGLAAVAGQLKDGLSKLTPEQRNAAQATIFGSDAVRASNVLYQEGAEGIAKWTKEVTEQGAAAKQAATLTDNLKGDIERFGGALDSVFIQTGSSANGSLRTLVQSITGLVGKIGAVPGPVLLAAGALSSFALLAPKGVIAYRGYMSQLDSLGLSMDKISAKSPKTAKALGGIGTAAKGIAAAAVAIAVLGDEMNKLGTEQLQRDLLASGDAAKTLDERINSLNKSGFGNGATNVRDFGDVLRYTFDPGFMDGAAHGIEGVLGIFGVEQTNDISIAGDRLKEIDTTLSGMVSSGAAKNAADLFRELATEAQKQGVSVDELKAKFPQYAEALAAVTNAATGATAPTAALADTTGDLKVSAEDAAQAQIDLAQSIVDAAEAMLSASDSDVALAQANVDLAKTAHDLNGATNKTKTAFDLSKKSGRDAQTALNDYAGSARTAARDNLAAGDSTKKVDAAMQVARKTFVDNAVKLGLSATAANKMANEFGLSTGGVKALKGSLDKLPTAKNVAVTVKTTGLSALQTAGTYLAGLKDKHVTLTVGTVKVGNSTVNAGQFADGGYTGDGAKYEPAGLVHRGEYVITKAATAAIGKSTLDYLNTQGRLPGYAGGGLVASSRFVPQQLAVSTRSTATSTGTSGPMQISGTVDMGNGLQGYIVGVLDSTVQTALGGRTSAGVS